MFWHFTQKRVFPKLSSKIWSKINCNKCNGNKYNGPNFEFRPKFQTFPNFFSGAVIFILLMTSGEIFIKIPSLLCEESWISQKHKKTTFKNVISVTGPFRDVTFGRGVGSKNPFRGTICWWIPIFYRLENKFKKSGSRDISLYLFRCNKCDKKKAHMSKSKLFFDTALEPIFHMFVAFSSL